MAEIAGVDERAAADVLLDIAGGEAIDRGTAINNLATAGARLVEAKEAPASAESFLRARPRSEARQRLAEDAKARVSKAEQDLELATAALKSAESSR